MAVSASPWWWSPELVSGKTWVSPIHSFSAPTVLPEIASNRRIPVVWAVSPDSAPAKICRSGRCQISSPPANRVTVSGDAAGSGWSLMRIAPVGS
jgi:hypothetical protein